MLCEPLMQSMCSLRHQCHSHGSLPHPVHHCPACAPEARRVVSALAERLKMPARAPDAPPVRRCSTRAPPPCLCAISAACREYPRRGDQNACSRARCRFVHPFPLSYAGSRSHSDSDMRVRAADPHSHMQARSSCVLYSRFPGSPASDSRFPGRNGRHKAGIRRETWNPQRKSPGPRTQKGSTTCED